MVRKLSKFLSAMLVICMVISMMPTVALAGPVTPRPSKLYLKPNSNWLEADARFAAYYYSDNSNGVWENMSDSDGDGIYEVPVPSTFDYVIFCRMNPTASVNSWGGKWNQTVDLTIPLDGNNLYTIEDGTWDNGNGTWSVLGSSGTTTDPEPTTVDYYLVGHINGADYGCNDDYQNLGIFKFVDNRLTATFVTDSYVFLKTSDNAKWFMAESYCTDTTCSMKLGGTEKMFVPGGVEVNFSLIVNSEDNVILSYYTSSTECNHSYTSKVTIPATCTGQSQTEFTCTLCGNQYWVIGFANGHSYEAAVTTAVTCTKDGVKTYTCSACGDSYTEVIPATGHNYSDGKCTVCGTADANCSHSYTSKVTIAATCLEDGVMTYTCSKCGDVYTETIPATGHSYVDEIVPPSCELNGYTKHRCEYCGEYTYNSDPVNPLGHDETSVVTAPTCTEQGYTTFTCNRCGQVREWYYTPATGHNYYLGKCTGCGDVDESYELNYYLVGWINGVDYGCNDDYQNMGEYKFVDGQLKAKFTQDSYVYIKTTNNDIWYMSTYFATQKAVTLYDTTTGANEKLYVPGNVELVFNLVENADGSLTLNYAVDPDVCSHSVHTTSGSCFNCGLIVEHTFVDGTCICGAKDPNYGDIETIYYLSGIGGVEYNSYDNPFVDGKITLDVPVTSYVWVIDNKGVAYKTDGWQGEVDSVILKYEGNVSGTPDKLMIPAGTVTLTLVENADGTLTLSYELISEPDLSKDYYLVGYINGANYGCDEDWENLGIYKFVNGSLTVTFEQDSYVFIKTGDNAKWYMSPAYDEDGNTTFYPTSTGAGEKMFVPGGVEVIFTLTKQWDDSFLLTYVINEDCTHATHDANGVCTDCGRTIGHNFVNGACTVCALTCNHSSIDNGYCTTCGYQLPVDYYLFGYINGANYGCEEDAATWGAYKFVDGKLTVTFTQDSYVAVKNTNGVWYMCEGYDATATKRTMYSADGLTYPEKMFVPGGVQVTFSLVTYFNRVELSYVTGEIKTPTLTLNYPSLSFEDEILYNVYYGIDDTSSVVEMGLVTFNSKLADGTIANAVDVIPGYVSDGTTYMAQTNGIPAKNLSDALYFKVYAKLTDGSYVYSDIAGYHAVAYANSVLNSSTASAKAKALVVAMLNYGAAAQTYFEYKTNALMNAKLTSAQKALVSSYSTSMVADVVRADSSKVGSFVMNGGYSNIWPTVSFEGAFSINFYFTPSNSVDSALTFYYWDAETYNSVSTLTAENATGVATMKKDDTNWGAAVEGIAAKDMDSTIYVAGIYTSNGVSYPTSVISYSLGQYCKTVAANGEAFGAATAVYGYYAKAYFA